MEHSLSYVGALAMLGVTFQLAAAQDIPSLTEKSIPCTQFKRLPNGDWFLKGPVLATVGTVTKMTLQDYAVNRTTTLGGINMHALLEKNCGPPE